MRVVKWILVFVAVVAAVAVAYSYHVSRPLFEETWTPKRLAIAPRSEALTFARTDDRLLLVLAHDDGAVRGIDLGEIYGATATADLLALYDALGYEALADLEASEVTIPVDALIEPYDYHFPFVAVGTNYAEHAAEVSLDDPPFLFPKLAAPTPWNAFVQEATRLDYEAALCLVPLVDITRADQDADFGLVLCNDFTDRWTLVREIDLDAPMGLTGFAAAKGQPTFLPTGYLFVIPRARDFYEQLGFELFVNDQLRQRFRAGEMILKPHDIVAQSFALADAPFERGDTRLSLLPEGFIPRGTLILTGTAAGVMFRPVNVWSGAFYLGRDDVVRTRADFLGELVNRVR